MKLIFFKSSRIRHLVLANGKTIIRNNKDHSLACSFYMVIYKHLFFTISQFD
ncbi:MAG: hypothetical protein CM15mP106_3960 [Candidatus Neomarinimicrobiota bacterium]|nr:MAG: hypothetical protein CM15mP106_3960 [Candidatus Neomarinimicrobiota bacterium]